MSDPLSIAASTAGLVSLGLQTIEYLVRFYTTYRERDTTLARTTERLSDLLRCLHTVDEIVRTRKWRANERMILENFERCICQSEDVIQELQTEVRKLQKDPKDSLGQTIRATGRRVTYPFRQSTLKKLDEDIDEFRDNVSIALQALQLKEHQNTQNDIEEMKQIIRIAQAQYLTTSIHHWLRAPDATPDYNAACTKRHTGTGRWLVRSPAFTVWLQQDNSFLWLYGFAGCGKSVLCATAIQEAFRHQRSRSNCALAFFFFTFNDESKQNASAMLRALLLQLAGQVADMDVDLTRLRNWSNQGIPPATALLEHLRQAVTRTHHTYILLDGLDECPVGDKREQVLSTIQTMRKWSLPGFHLLVTSRDLVDIREALDAENRQRVALTNDNIGQDIVTYVSHEIANNPRLKRWAHHRSTIQKRLVQNANGV